MHFERTIHPEDTNLLVLFVFLLALSSCTCHRCKVHYHRVRKLNERLAIDILRQILLRIDLCIAGVLLLLLLARSSGLWNNKLLGQRPITYEFVEGRRILSG